VRVGVVNGIIYAIGGYDGSAHLNTVECFDPMTNTWKPVASMASRRSSAGVAVLNDMLYVVGELHVHVMLRMVANVVICIIHQASFSYIQCSRLQCHLVT